MPTDIAGILDAQVCWHDLESCRKADNVLHFMARFYRPQPREMGPMQDEKGALFSSVLQLTNREGKVSRGFPRPGLPA
jgi:hypothetical protein